MRKTTTYLGIDPGLQGAIAIIGTSGTEGAIWNQVPILIDTPVYKVDGKHKYDIPEMIKILRDFNEKESHIIIEEVGAMPGQGVTSMFSMGYGLGLWHMAIQSCGFPMTRVRPQKWKKMFGLSKDKNASILRAKEIFPNADITLKKHADRAEALLLAEYLRRTL